MQSLIRTVGLLAVAMILCPATAVSSFAQEENPIVAAVKSQVEDSSKPFTMFVLITVKKEAGPKFETAFAKAIVETRKEKGNRTYDLNRSSKSPQKYIVYERWANLDALRVHMKTPHIKTLLTDIGDLLQEAPEVKVFLPVAE